MLKIARRVLRLAAATLAMGAVPAQAANVTIAPATPEGASNCYPFGVGNAGADEDWLPNAAFFYRNIPAFTIHSGDRIRFDLSGQNDTDIQLNIAMAPTTTNGGLQEARPFRRVVKRTQAPRNPRGNETVGDFELNFKAQSNFAFGGRGLIIRFSDPASAFATDTTCTPTIVTGNSSDPSGFFVARAYNDLNGAFPWSSDPADIGGFRIVDLTPPQTTITKHPKRTTEKHRARFKFASDEPDSIFKCKLDKRRFRRCGRQRPVKVYRGLDAGEHKFKVKARDSAGHTDPTPAKFEWEIAG